MLITDLLIKYLRILKVQLLIDKPIGCRLIKSTFNDAERQINSRAHRQHNNQNDVFTHHLLACLIHKFLTLEVHHPHTDEGSQTDKYGVDKVEVECTQKVNQIARCQTITCRTKGRHQRRSNGNSRNHISLLFGRQGDNSRQTTEKCDEYVINRRRSTRQQLRLCFGNRSEKKEDGCRRHTESSRDEEALQRTFHQFEIIQTDRKPDTHDRSHQR